LAQYREKAAFAQFGSDLDPATQKQLARGQRLTEVLKQDQYVPMPVERQILIVYAGTHGYLDKHPINKLKAYETQLYEFTEKKYPEIFKDLVSKGKIEDDLNTKIENCLKEFEKTFVV
ncbi:MAG: F0F1 ATP synthase subunit alpha, partial [Bdellovibrio sp.]|nr:F0F1 ATP synthase subunit alpha [Bdellovibrio sp.]